MIRGAPIFSSLCNEQIHEAEELLTRMSSMKACFRVICQRPHGPVTLLAFLPKVGHRPVGSFGYTHCVMLEKGTPVSPHTCYSPHTTSLQELVGHTWGAAPKAMSAISMPTNRRMKKMSTALSCAIFPVAQLRWKRLSRRAFLQVCTTLLHQPIRRM